MIIGIGTGRCGGHSLSVFLDNQPNVTFSHHGGGLRWWPVSGTFTPASEILQEASGKYIGDFNPAWVNYIDRMPSDTKIIWLQRDDLWEVAQSFFSYKGLALQYNVDLNLQYDQTPIQEQDISLDCIYRAVNRIWWLCSEVERLYGFAVFTIKMEELNNKKKQTELLNWIGVPEGDHKLVMPFLNTREEMIAVTREALEAGRT